MIYLISDFKTKVLLCIPLTLLIFAVSLLNIYLFFLISISTLVAFSATKSYKLSFIFFLLLFFFQNIHIAYLSPFITHSTFKILHGTHLVILLALFTSLLLDGDFFRNIFNTISSPYIILSLVILFLYFFLGVLNYGLRPSLIYLRLFSLPIFLYLVGQYFGEKLSSDNIFFILKLFLFITAASCLMYVVFFKFSIYFFNDQSYLYHKIGPDYPIDAYYHKNNYFNINWFPKALRTGGILKTVISASYFILISAIYLFLKKKISLITLILCCFIIIIAVNSKGAIILLLTVCFVFVLKSLKCKNSLIIFVTTTVWIFIIYLGYKSRNEHIFGFLSGLKYLTGLGNGLGFSGNLSSIQLVSVFGSELPDIGFYTRLQNGSESAFGVLFSSLGITALIFIFCLIKIINNSEIYIHYRNPNIKTICLIVLFLGIFQEEAFSPYALGLAFILLGIEEGFFIRKKNVTNRLLNKEL